MGFRTGSTGSPTFHGSDPRATPLATAIDARIDGSVRADTYTRHLFATDASLYRALPVAVVFPRSAEDVYAVVDVCRERDVPLLPRGGGTSLAGQTVNEAVVLDCSRHLSDVTDIDHEEHRVTAQPGVVLGELNERLEDEGLRFAPDPAWRNHSTLGGAIGNDSSGAHSLVYGTTRDHVHELEVVFIDGTVARLGPIEIETVHEQADPEGDAYERLLARASRLLSEGRERIEAAYPDLHRNTAGYALDTLLETDDRGRINLARLFVGSEGTLGVVTQATVAVVEPPDAVGAILLSYDDHQAAMADVPAILELDPAAVETMDEPVLEIARDHPTFADVARLPHPEASGVLLVECFGETEAEVRDQLAELEHRFGPSSGSAIDARIATDDEERTRFWQLRKSSLPLLLSKTTDEKHIALVEDVAVPPDELASFVAGFRDLLADHDTTASFYGHAGASVLHVRPLIDTISSTGRETMRSVASEVFDLAMAHGGTITGEHGDGRARTEWTQRQYDPAIIDEFRALKRAVDPNGLLNPGPIAGTVDLTEA
ncbi:MAG: FAD-binding oxidoreductase, partial [Halobacteriota archaeon]